MDTMYLTEKIEHIAYRIWGKNTCYQIQERMLDIWDRVADETGTKYEPLFDIESGENITCGISGSGSFSTGREELWRAKKLRDKLGWSPVEYISVITNRKDSKARKVVEEYNKAVLWENEICYVELDYGDWKKENDIIGSTKIFGFRSDEIPSPEVLQERIRIRKMYDDDLKNFVTGFMSEMPHSLSLRGYNSILMDTFFPSYVQIQVDNTHPATLVTREGEGRPRYAGWQEDATDKMRKDHWRTFPASLIRVEPVTSLERLSSDVDSGELLGLSPGRPGNYDKTEDYFLLTLKATGLLPYFWGLSKAKKPVKYLTLKKEPIMIEQREVIVVDRVMSGMNAFGQKEEDLNIFSRFK